MNVRQEFIDVAGIRFRVLRWGLPRAGRPPLLLLHGFTGTAELWESFAVQLAEEREILAVDLPGHGGTRCLPDSFAFSTQAVAVTDLCARLGELHLLGYSMGGRIALGSALRAAPYLRSLILESAHPGLPRESERAARAADDAAWIDLLQTGGIETFARKWTERPLFSLRKSLPDELQAQIRAAIVRQDPQGLAAALAGAGLSQQPNMLEDASALPVPVLVVTGELDEKFNRLGAQIAAAAQRARFTTIAKAGHTPHWENPDAFLETVRTFLSAVDAAPKTSPHGKTFG